MLKKTLVLLFLITLVFVFIGTSTIVTAGDEPLLIPGSFCSNYNFGSPMSSFWFVAWCVGDGIGWSYEIPV